MKNLFYFILHILSIFADHSAGYYLNGDVAINCGSTGMSTAYNGREWIGDIKQISTSSPQIKGSSTSSSTTHDLISVDLVPYKTARISRSQFSYAFRVSPGLKLIRLHFSLALYRHFEKSRDLFSVQVGPFTLLSNFSASVNSEALGVKSFVKEYCITVEENQLLNIIFSPEYSHKNKTYAFINGIEVISLPTELYYSHSGGLGAQVVGEKSQIFIDKSTALEILQRINIIWDPIALLDNSGKLRMWETLPNKNADKMKNFTWKISVDVGFAYLVRLHFQQTCNEVYSVHINDMNIETNVDMKNERGENGVLWYRDYIVMVKGNKEEASHDLTITLQLKGDLINGPLKGVEICKLSNLYNSLASHYPVPPTQAASSSVTLKLLLSVFGRRNTVVTGLVIIITVVNIIAYKLRQIWEANTIEDKKPSTSTGVICHPFSLAEIQSATDNFNETLVIGKGGFGEVYKGFLENGQLVAVKRLKSNSKQGEQEFWTEISMLSKLQHTNLVSLVGYCNECQEMILVYEYIPYGTLADHLFGLRGESDYHYSLSWKQRLRICVGVARGLDYIHTGMDRGIIHRDIKASNILLDEHLEAKISDFGLAKPHNNSKFQSHVSTDVKGTFGYFDPDYFRTRKLTKKSDTYAFGVVLLELLCGKPAVRDSQGLVMWAQDCISKGNIDQIVAPSLRGQISPNCLKTFLEISERCLQKKPKRRPSMGQVVVQLEFALKQQETSKSSVPKMTGSDDVENSVRETIQPISIGNQEMIWLDKQNTSPPLGERTKSIVQNDVPSGRRITLARRKTNACKLSLLRPLDAFWNRAQPSKKKKKVHLSVSEYYEEKRELRRFDLAVIAVATNGFSVSNEIGKGQYGTIYKGLLSKGEEIAVKRSSPDSQHGFSEYKNEILLASKLQHRNLLRLLGYCFHREEMMLVYEFMENRSLDAFIFDEARRRELRWTTRFKIIIGIARGIRHLHQNSGLKIIHRDLKASNILLDNEMNPKISEFGAARTLEEYQTETTTVRVVETYGYMSPEYVIGGILSVKTDVFSFGVIVLEIVSGSRNSKHFSDAHLICYAWKMWNEGKALELLDNSIEDEFSGKEALRCIQVGLLCVQEHPDDRPTIMSVLKMLEGEIPKLPQPKQPAYWNAADSRLKFDPSTDTTKEVVIGPPECR